MRLQGIRRNAPRSSKTLARRLRLQEAGDAFQLLQTLLGQRPLGRVWMPQPAVHLSAQAGAAFRMRLLTPKALGSGACRSGIWRPTESMTMDHFWIQSNQDLFHLCTRARAVRQPLREVLPFGGWTPKPFLCVQ